MVKSLVSTSKFLSLIHRHKPEAIDVSLDPEGWLDIDTLIDAANKHGRQLSLALVHRVISENDKRRFALSEDGLRIRANQGHSIPSVDLALNPVEPPPQLFHGTVAQFLAGIRELGLRKRSRNYVHLSSDTDTAQRVGMRRGKPVVLKIDSASMYSANFPFYLSDHGVWLTDSVPVKFIQFPDA